MATTMHFGPEWMRTKTKNHPPSPPPASHAPLSGASTYSALVSPAPPQQPEKRDESHPFRYSKEEMLRIYKEGGGKGGLGLEVERWEGIVRENGSEPVGLREMSDAEKKLFASPLNSDLRRRQSTDYLSPLNTSTTGERPRLNTVTSAAGSPLRERFGSLMGRRRGDSTDQPPTLPRKSSVSNNQGPLLSPREGGLPSPRTRGGTTPGFDGVLGSDSWMARRRASDAPSKGGVGGTGNEQSPGSKGQEIREEEEEAPPHLSDAPTQSTNSSALDAENLLHSNGVGNETQIIRDNPTAPVDAFSNLSLSTSQNASSPITASTNGSGPDAGPPPGLPDLASIEWSYLDPQGQVQGPFRADLMQKWFDEGYFTPDLLMKRTLIETEWTPVGELARRSAGGKIFLTALPPSTLPPGLPRQTESPVLVHRQDQNVFNAPGPYQPIPTRSLRPSAIDSYLGTNSNAPDSPTSSFGAGRYGDGSPDPSTFGGRASNNIYPGIDSTPLADHSSTFAAARRNTFNEHPNDHALGGRIPAFNNAAPGRAGSIDSYGFTGAYNSPQTPWQTSSSAAGQGGPSFDPTTSGRNLNDPMTVFPSTYSVASPSLASGFGGIHDQRNGGFGDGNQGHLAFTTQDYSAAGELGIQRDMHLANRDDRLPTGAGFNYTNGYSNGFGSPSFGNQAQTQPFPQSPYVAHQQAQQGPQQLHVPAQQMTPSPKGAPAQAASVAPTSSVQSPWNTQEPTVPRRPGPFEADHPTAKNTVPTQQLAPSSEPSPWGRASQPTQRAPQGNNASPWVSASQGVVDDSWKDVPSAPDSLTFSNLGEHNEQQKASAIVDADSARNAADTKPHAALAGKAAVPSSPAAATLAPSQPPKNGRKSSAQATASQPAAKPTASAPSPSPPPPTQTKPAWSTEDESNKAKPSGVSLGLREIQEAEAKKLEARKAAERERERAARASVPVTSEDLQPFTASWGLPTSRAGGGHAQSAKDNSGGAASSNPASTTPPVWTNSAKSAPTRKTMKEIQEEEERRKKLAVKETVAVTAARRAYAETTNKAAPPVQSATWTTVGPSGKAPTPQSAPARPAVTPATSTAGAASSSPASRPINGTASRPSTATSASKAAPRIDDLPVTPSREFLKWLSDSLKGLNSTVNFEEITSMLLSFPVDPDSSTAEIISDLIYANSTTLDGRRFASDFVSRRKADAIAIRNRGGAAAASKPVSIADVVKAQPKPSQPEWGGFKVVNKKKKGGRA
ncbi:hypothetical protein PLICRDRAFT_695434 [Plicaturopsis crispa FD-325 SS-3]|nr:hypothetical protein PLICRDRAFT_695434 [Plicaturopsis crispa FD-325 SS-3]